LNTFGANIESQERRGFSLTFLAVASLVLVGSAAPAVIYWLVFGRIPTVLPEGAKQLLRNDPAATVLVDVRPPEAFAAGHIDGAVHWPNDQLLAVGRPDELPPQFQGKTLLLVCDVGVASRRAAWHLGRMGVEHAKNVRGGIQEWMRSATAGEAAEFDRWRTGPNQVGPFPFRHSPLWEQVLAVLAFFFLKPIYTLLSLAVAIALWRSRSPDLVALRWGMICFFLGENACAVNYFACKETSYLFEYLHSVGMFLCFGFVAYSVLDGIDRRILGLSDPQRQCAAVRLCGACVKHAPVPCGLKHAFFVLILALMAVAMMLPSADWRDTSYHTLVFGESYHYAHLRVYQQLENWYCAAAATVMFAASLGILALKRHDPIAPAKIALAAGLGPLGFGMLRLFLGGAYDQNRVWYLFWEEATELLLILGVCCSLWIFRRGLFPGIDAWIRSVLGLGEDDEAGKPPPHCGALR
jgi:thiosulfate sulfurtransferase